MKQLFKSIVNLILIITLPIWGGTFLFFVLFIDFGKNKYERERAMEILTGRRWFFA